MINIALNIDQDFLNMGRSIYQKKKLNDVCLLIAKMNIEQKDIVQTIIVTYGQRKKEIRQKMICQNAWLIIVLLKAM